MGQPEIARLYPGSQSSPRQAREQHILEGAQRCLQHNSYLSLKNVHCLCREDVLILRGCVSTYYLKQMAQMAVSQVEGVSQIVNEIEVVSCSPR